MQLKNKKVPAAMVYKTVVAALYLLFIKVASSD